MFLQLIEFCLLILFGLLMNFKYSFPFSLMTSHCRLVVIHGISHLFQLLTVLLINGTAAIYATLNKEMNSSCAALFHLVEINVRFIKKPTPPPLSVDLCFLIKLYPHCLVENSSSQVSITAISTKREPSKIITSGILYITPRRFISMH